MAVTLNYTSKGLIDAIRRQLEQQKQEGKISGDTSYKSIVTCDFWTTLKNINDSHRKQNKKLIYHQKSYSCKDKGKPVDWKKTVVVYGKAELDDVEWKMLVESMGLSITTTATEEIQETTSAKEQTKPAEETEEIQENGDIDTDVLLGTYSILITELKKSGMDEEQAANYANKIIDSGYSIKKQDGKIVAIDKQHNSTSLSQVISIIQMTDMKNNSIENTENQ